MAGYRVGDLASKEAALLQTAGMLQQLVKLETQTHSLAHLLYAYQQIFDHTTLAMYLVERNGEQFDGTSKLIAVNRALATVLGKTSAELTGKTIEQGLPKPLYQEFNRHWRDCVRAGQTVSYEDQFSRGRERRLYHTALIPITQEGGGVQYLAGVVRDNACNKMAMAVLRARADEMSLLVEYSPDRMLRLDDKLRVVYLNPSMLDQLNLSWHQAYRMKIGDLLAAHSGVQTYLSALHQVLASGTSIELELADASSVDGAMRYEHVSIIAEKNAVGLSRGLIVISRDITQQKLLELTLQQREALYRRQAYFDPLTGLPNRALLAETLQQMTDPAGKAQHFGLMMLDLDHFKEINDSLGHAAGDQLLCEVGLRLRGCLRSCDTVARLGGDEFALLLPVGTDTAHLSLTASSILDLMSAPFMIEGHELFVSASIGIALYPEHSCDAGVLYKYADSAMYYAKREGRNHFQFYASELTAQVSERLELEVALRKAGRKGEFELYFQPQVDLMSDRIVGAEALLRWHRPGFGLVRPNDFISVAESSGLIIAIGEWVLTQACQLAAEWNRQRAQPIKIAVNLSTRQFLRNDLLATLRRVLATSGCQPGWLKLEITESLLLEDSDKVAAMLDQICDLGLSISIDDFGTGYSALSYLNRFPVNQIKIDRSFVHDVPAVRDKSELVKAMLLIGSALRLETVAEGVETRAQADYLTRHGCMQAQGFLFGRPMPASEFYQALQDQDSQS